MIIKQFLQGVVANAIGIFATPYIVTGFKIQNNVETVLITAVVLVLVNFFIKPLIKIISFPINLVTLGFFGLLINSIMLFITDYLVDGLEITEGLVTLEVLNLGLPAFAASSIVSIIAASTVIGLIHWVLRKVLL
jgi:putative membrane protein